VEPEARTLKDYIAIYKRRKKQFFYPTVALLSITILVVVFLPSIYRSSATILIESQDIPTEFVTSTVTSYANERLQIISQRAMTTRNLSEIIKKYNLYTDEKKRKTSEEIINNMRDDINLDTVSANVMDPRSGRPLNITIAFTLSYDSENPFDAQRVATELTSLYLKENIRERTKKATETTSFLETEGTKLKNKISKLEKSLAEFKEKNNSNLPELTQLNLQMMERSERDLMDVQRQIRSINERKVLLQADLAQINPYTNMISSTGERILGPSDRLKSLEAEYVSKSGIYAKEHPDIIRMRREIDSLSKKVNSKSGTTILNSKLRTAEGELAQLRKNYLADHPDILRLESIIRKLKSSLSDAIDESTQLVAIPDNPAYIQLKAQFNAAVSEVNSLKVMREKIKKKVGVYEARIIAAPQIEREYKSLMRDYENSIAKYQEIRSKWLQAGLAEELEKDSKGERFTLIEPPLLPELPEKPNRAVIFILGLFLSISGGLGIAALSEALDPTIHGIKGVANVVGVSPLVGIPYIDLPSEVEKKLANSKLLSRRNLIILSLLIGLGVLGLILIHFNYKPLDVLWYVVLRKLGI